MSHLKLTNKTSCSKIGAGLGIIMGGYMFRNDAGHNIVFGTLVSIANTILGVAGSAIGSQIILSSSKAEITEKDLENQVKIVKNHFDKINPIETNYNLYSFDPIGENFMFSWIKDLLSNSSKEDFDNKFLSTKYLVFDYLRNATPYDVALDAAPAIGGAVKILINGSYTQCFATCIEVSAVYAARSYLLNYYLYREGFLNDIELLELECNKNELQSFQEVIPEELYIEMNRVAV